MLDVSVSSDPFWGNNNGKDREQCVANKPLSRVESRSGLKEGGKEREAKEVTFRDGNRCEKKSLMENRKKTEMDRMNT
jgi:hypothetical protein